MRVMTDELKGHYYPGMIVLVTVEWENKKNIMASGFHSFISIEPPIFGVSIGHERYTHHLVKNAGEFGINFLPFELANITQRIGSLTGEEVDKFKLLNIKFQPGRTITAPILEKAYVAYECKVIDIKTYGDHDWFVGEITQFYRDYDVFQENGLPDLEKISIPLYLGRSQYLRADKDSYIQEHIVNNE